MKINISTVKNAMKVLLKMYVLLMVFISTQKYTTLIIVAFCGLMFLCYIALAMVQPKLLVVNKREFVVWTTMIALIGITVFLSDYPATRMIQNTIILFVLYLLQNEKIKFNEKSKHDWFYLVFCLLLGVQLYETISGGGTFKFANFSDRNYVAIIIFLFFLYCRQKKYLGGVILTLVFATITVTRLFFVAIISSLVIDIILKSKIANKISDVRLDEKQVIKLFTALLAFSIMFSWIWVNCFVGENTTAYKVGWNDSSNAIRMNSNLYAFHRINEDKELLWRGYDTQINKALGVDSEFLENHQMYKGYRIVQPHNCYINPLLVHGAVYSVLYFLILSKIFAGHLGKKNAACWGAYLICTLFMHSLLSSFFLCFLILIILEPEQEKSESKLYRMIYLKILKGE